MQNESQTIQLIIQAGAVGLCILLIIYNWRRDVLYNKTINNHLDHLSQYLIKSSDASSELSGSLNKLSEKIERCPNRK